MYDLNNFGVSDDYEYHEILLDSRDTTSAFNGTYTKENWPKFQLGKPLDNVAAIKVLQVVVPKTYYTINSTNNTFNFWTFFVSDNPRWTNRGPVTIPVGHYTKAELNTVLSSVLTTAISISITFNLTDLPAQMKTFWDNTGTDASNRTFMYAFSDPIQYSTVYPSLNTITNFLEVNNNARTNPRLVLGWEGGAGTTSGTLVSSNTGLPAGTPAPYRNNQVVGGLNISKDTTTTNVDQIDGPPYLYLNSRTFGGMIHMYLNGLGHMNTGNESADGPQICQIPVTNVTRGKNIIYSDPDPQKWFFLGNVEFPKMFDLYLTAGVSSPFVPLDLNGASFVVKLGILTNKKTNEQIFASTSETNRVTKLISAKG